MIQLVWEHKKSHWLERWRAISVHGIPELKILNLAYNELAIIGNISMTCVIALWMANSFMAYFISVVKYRLCENNN